MVIIYRNAINRQNRNACDDFCRYSIAEQCITNVWSLTNLQERDSNISLMQMLQINPNYVQKATLPQDKTLNGDSCE